MSLAANIGKDKIEKGDLAYHLGTGICRNPECRLHEQPVALVSRDERELDKRFGINCPACNKPVHVYRV